MSDAATDLGSGQRRASAGRAIALTRSLVAGQPVFVGLVLAVVLGTVLTATAVFTASDARHAVVVDLGGPMVFRPLPEIVTNLAASGNRSHFIKVSAVLQLPEKQAAAVVAKELEVLAAVQGALQTLKRQDVVGGAGADRLRDTVLGAVNRTLAPAQVRTVLFTQVLVD